MKPLVRYSLIAALVVLIDQLVKLYVKFHFQLGEEVPVLGSFFRLHFTENKGAAFGLTFTTLFGMGDEAGKLLLTLFSLGLVGFIVYYLYSLRHAKGWLPILVALILGGAVGNIIDRVFYGSWFAAMNDYEGGLFHGRVVDMFYFHFWEGILPDGFPFWGGTYTVFDFAIFNIADAAITIGILAILIFQKRLFALAAGPQPQPTGPDSIPPAPAPEPQQPTSDPTV